jgi:hypothetical protein
VRRNVALGTRVIEDSRRLRPAWSDKARNAGVREPRRLASDRETPQPGATGVHNMAGMGQSRSGATSNNNSLAALHSGLEQAYEERGVP